MMQMLLIAFGVLAGVGIVTLGMWCVAVLLLRYRRAHDLDLISLRDEVAALEEENSILRASLETAAAVTRARIREVVPARVPLH